MSGKTKQKKNPLKSGNPAVVAAAKAQASHPKKQGFIPSTSVKPKESTYVPAGNDAVVAPAPRPRSKSQKKADRFRKAGQVTVILFFLGSMIMTMFAGLGNQTSSPTPTETSKVLVDQAGNPIGSGTATTPTSGSNVVKFSSDADK